LARTAIDLFAGAGGATQGLTEAGLRVVAAIENDAAAARSYQLNHPEARLICADIRDVSADGLRSDVKMRAGDLSLLQACPPCQTWSSLARTKEEDPRNDLIFDVYRFVAAFLPSAFVLENVPGLAADRRLRRFTDRTRRLGYGTRLYRINATDFGVAQRRRRLIVLGIREGDGRQFPRDLSRALPEDFDTTIRPVLEVLGQAGPINEGDELHQAKRRSPEVMRRIESIPIGGSRFDLPDDLQLRCHAKLRRRNATAAYGRINLTGPAPTLTTRCTTPSCGPFIHPTDDRGITLREASLLQSFPLTYRFEGTYMQVERQIGNAVPVPVARGIALIATQLVTDVAG
jgi:DNA (cytosine-5)-methyltransferase 1